jgi:Tfp pilus assembly protein PilZ
MGLFGDFRALLPPGPYLIPLDASETDTSHPRNRARLIARFNVEGCPERTGFTTNLSLGGAFVHTRHVYKPDTIIRVELASGNSKITLKAVVVWAKLVPAQLAHLFPCGMGLRFIDPGMDWKEFYENWRGRPLAVARAR